MSPQYNKQELCNAIYSAVCSSDSALTRLEICRAIGRKKSPHIIAMIEDLVLGGWLLKDHRLNNKGVSEFVYIIGRAVDVEGACNGQ